MSDLNGDFIEYIGISPAIPSLNEFSAFKQLEIQDTLTIPALKPDIEQIIKVSVEIQLNCSNLISTPVATSAEGQVLTGRKVMVHGMLSEEVVYVADTPTQSVHAAHFEHCITAFIVIPNNFPTDAKYFIRSYIEDIHAQLIDSRTLSKSVLVLLTLSY